MAKIRLSPQRNIAERSLTVVGKRPFFANRLKFYERGGSVVVELQPEAKKRRNISESEMLTRLWLKYSAYLYKVAAAEIVEVLRSQAVGLWLQPRDIFTAALAGRLFYFELPDGRLLFSAAVRDEMSNSFDVFGTETGLLVVRRQDGWRGLASGSPGDVLTVGADSVPFWSPPSGQADYLRRVWLDGVHLQGTGQGGGNVALPNGRRGVTLPGTATSSVSFSTLSVPDAHTLAVRVYLARAGSDLGDYDVGLSAYVYSASSQILDSYSVREVFPAPLPNAEMSRVFTFELPQRDGRHIITFSLVRYGAVATDTNNSHAYLWGVEVYHV